MRRLSSAARKKKLAEADALAREQARVWRVFYARTKTTGVKLVELPTAGSEQQAIKRVKGGYEARPVLPSRLWRRIYEEVGLA